MKKIAINGLGLIVSCLVFFSCSRNKFDIDVSHIKVELKISRFERDFFAANHENLNEFHKKLYEKYGVFYQRYVENMTGIGLVNDPAISYSLQTFLSDKYIKEIYDDTEKKFSGDLNVEYALTDAFKHCKYYFPEMIIPEIITFISGFNYAIAVTDSVLGIGLDMYLGNDYKNYAKSGFPLYKITLMNREYIISDAMKSWLMTEFFSDENKHPKDVLGTMIMHGKIMYLLDAVLPNEPDSIQIGYSRDQLEFCEKNEFNIWAHLVDKQLLYSSENQTIAQFFNDAPFTSGLPKESAPKIGIWVGWQIVKSYMENNSEFTLTDLMKKENAQEILTLSKYKPKK